MKRFLMHLLAVAALGAATSAGFAQDTEEPAPDAAAVQDITPFGTVVRRNWPRWAQDSRTINRLDLIIQIAKPDYRGEDAAALVTLEAFLRKYPAVSLEMASALDDPKFLATYHRNVIKLSQTKRVLFANGNPTFELLQQGPPGDSYLFSAAGWMAKNRPDAVKKIITPLSDGRFQVRFANGEEAVVPVPTDAELAVIDAASTLRDGLWMPVLEKAAEMLRSRSFSRLQTVSDPAPPADIPETPIAGVIRRWTGHRTELFRLGREGQQEQVRTALIRMQQQHLLTIALLLHPSPAKLPFDHAYAVLEFDETKNVVTIWNPWGTDFTPKGLSGPENGYARRNGVFQLSLKEFMAFYTVLAMEENAGG